MNLVEQHPQFIENVRNILNQPAGTRDLSGVGFWMYRHLFSLAVASNTPDAFKARVEALEKLGFRFVLRDRKAKTKKVIDGVRQYTQYWDLLAVHAVSEEIVVATDLKHIHLAHFQADQDKYKVVHGHDDKELDEPDEVVNTKKKAS